MLNHLKAVFGDLTIVVPEPMRYWTHVYENAIKAMHKNVTRARHGREDTSAEVLACQMKFTTPFRVLASRKRMICQVGHNWNPRALLPLSLGLAGVLGIIQIQNIHHTPT